MGGKDFRFQIEWPGKSLLGRGHWNKGLREKNETAGQRFARTPGKQQSRERGDGRSLSRYRRDDLLMAEVCGVREGEGSERTLGFVMS